MFPQEPPQGEPPTLAVWHFCSSPLFESGLALWLDLAQQSPIEGIWWPLRLGLALLATLSSCNDVLGRLLEGERHVEWEAQVTASMCHQIIWVRPWMPASPSGSQTCEWARTKPWGADSLPILQTSDHEQVNDCYLNYQVGGGFCASWLAVAHSLHLPSVTARPALLLFSNMIWFLAPSWVYCPHSLGWLSASFLLRTSCPIFKTQVPLCILLEPLIHISVSGTFSVALWFFAYRLKVEVVVTQSCPTLCDPEDWSLPGSSVYGILQARKLEWVAISFSRGSSRPRDGTQVSSIAGRLFTIWATWDLHVAAATAKSLQSCLTLCDPIDSPPGSPIPGILQARTREWVAISFSNAGKWKVKVKSLSCVQLVAIPWTATHQAPPPMGFFRQEY